MWKGKPKKKKKEEEDGKGTLNNSKDVNTNYAL